jgi:hypothetical protein
MELKLHSYLAFLSRMDVTLANGQKRKQAEKLQIPISSVGNNTEIILA